MSRRNIVPPVAPPIIAALECVDVNCCEGIGIELFDCVDIADEKEDGGRDEVGFVIALM